MMDPTKIAAAAAMAAAKGPDMTKATAGGGDYVPPAAGRTWLRFVSYVEIGKHEKVYKGVAKTAAKVLLTFELHGPNHPPMENGEPQRITIEENLSLNEKANFFKLFQRMNYAGKAKHIAQLLGEGYLGTIFHRPWKTKEGQERIAAELRAKGEMYAIEAPRYQDPATMEVKTIAIPPAKSPLRLFLWDFADMDQWNSLFVEGEYPERKNDKGEVTAKAKSKNVLQARVKLAKNFAGSPIHTLLTAGGKPIDIPDAEDGNDPTATPNEDDDQPAAAAVAPAVTPTGAAATDALNDIVPA